MKITYEQNDIVRIDDDIIASEKFAAGYVILIKKYKEGSWHVRGMGYDNWSPEDETDIINEIYFNPS